MKINFNANQEYQLQAINAVCNIFNGQPSNGIVASHTSTRFNDGAIANNISISDREILENTQTVQKTNELPQSQGLNERHFSVEMETGTGKTYVYLRTIYELHKRYDFKKFVIVVPSVAIRAGVLKNLEITKEHFQTLYDHVSSRFCVYNSKKLSNLQHFAKSNNIEILIINIAAFAKDENIINRPNDNLIGRKPIEFIQATRPIVVIDEPQNMETEKRIQAISNLNYFCTLRYSATHTKLYNLLYSLNPIKAYDLGLVKQIEVDSSVIENNFNDAYIYLNGFHKTKNRISASLTIDCNTNDGIVRKTVKAKIGNDLYELSNQRDVYRHNYILNTINEEQESITFSGGKTIALNAGQGLMRDELMKQQIDRTIEEHFEKEKKYKERGIKVLSLFFIDRVANYRIYDTTGNPKSGKFANWFEEIFSRYANDKKYKGVIPFSAQQVHNGYFAKDKKGKLKDSQISAKAQADVDIFRLIMEEKEQLLDPDEPLRFIFSHSALNEGWDNPNVFQICTLNERRSELRKRQEIGRGMRLAVNSRGDRIEEASINRLTVVANESYDTFSKSLQQEIENDCGISFEGKIKKKQERKLVTYRKGFHADPKFLAIWDRIKHQTKYSVRYSTSKLIKQASESIHAMPNIRRVTIRSERTLVTGFDQKGMIGETKQASIAELTTKFCIPDILDTIQKQTQLTRSTILQILEQSQRLQDVFTNPQFFLEMTTKRIKEVLNEFIVNGIKYEKIGDKIYEMRTFHSTQIDAYFDKNSFKVQKQDKTIYDEWIPLDSQPEYQFAKDCESRDDIGFYFKLPYWFIIKTPIGNYNPDWALIKKNETTIYFIAETKSENQELRPSEATKIKCGVAHFKEFKDIKYRQVSKVSELDYSE